VFGGVLSERRGGCDVFDINPPGSKIIAYSVIMSSEDRENIHLFALQKNG
jgi:hypothetical protein